MEAQLWVLGATLIIALAPSAYFRLKALHRIERKLDDLIYRAPYGELHGVAKHAQKDGNDDRRNS